MKKPKGKYSKKFKCKCGKFAPIVPYCCSKCGGASIEGFKIEVVNFGKIKLPSGLKLE